MESRIQAETVLYSLTWGDWFSAGCGDSHTTPFKFLNACRLYDRVVGDQVACLAGVERGRGGCKEGEKRGIGDRG